MTECTDINPKVKAACALGHATAIAESTTGSDVEQIRFGMWMGIAQEWIRAAALPPSPCGGEPPVAPAV